MSTQPLTFITGATGFVGSAVARCLLKRGHRLRVLSRPNNDRRNLEGLDIEIVEGDLGDPVSYTHTLAGCDALFHVAADYRLWVPNASEMNRANVEGTRAPDACGANRWRQTHCLHQFSRHARHHA